VRPSLVTLETVTDLETLTALVAPPASPAGAPFDWPAIEGELGMPLPRDYKAYCDTHGHGAFRAGWALHPLTPGGDGLFDDLLATGWRDGPYAHPPRPPFPAQGGLATGYFAQFVGGDWFKGWSEPDDDEEPDPPVFYPAR
jgi:hypothetical protein